jgi:hypothetical protein
VRFPPTGGGRGRAREVARPASRGWSAGSSGGVLIDLKGEILGKGT